MLVRKIEIDLMSLTDEQWDKLDKVLRKHIPFRAIRWVEYETGKVEEEIDKVV